MRIVSIFASLLLFAAAAHSDPLDFESFANGTQLSDQLPGLHFENAVVWTAGVTLNEFEVPPRSGQNVAVDDGGFMSITLLSPSAHFSGYFTYTSPLALQGFNASGLLIATASSAFQSNLALSGDAGSSPNELIALTSAAPLSRVVVMGSPAGYSFAMDDVVLAQVAEPSAAWLLGGGLGFLAAVARWRRSSRKGLGRRAGRHVMLLSLAFLAAVVLPRAALAGDLAIFPSIVPANKATTITASFDASDVQKLIPGSLSLVELSPQNTVVRSLAALLDDGKNGDDRAGDRIFTARFSPSLTAGQQIILAVSYAVTGSLRRSLSTPAIAYADDVSDRSTYAVSDNRALVFRDASGRAISSIRLRHAEPVTSVPPGTSTPVSTVFTDEAFTSPSQERAGVVTSTIIGSPDPSSNGEGEVGPSTFAYFSSSGTLLFNRTAQAGRSYFVDGQNATTSKRGDRVLLVEVDDEGADPLLTLLTDSGTQIATFPAISSIVSLDEARLSENGRYIGLRGHIAPSSPSGRLLFGVVVIDTLSGAMATRANDFDAPPLDLFENENGTFSVLVGTVVGEQLP